LYILKYDLIMFELNWDLRRISYFSKESYI
jgi:hypothetical protein